MDHKHRMPLEIPEEEPGEALPLLYEIFSRRPYQAYCVTEASSRPPSPDSLIPKPLRTSATPVLQVLIDTESLETQVVDQNNHPTQTTASSPEQYVESATLHRTGKYSKRQTSSSNQESLLECTRSGNTPNHITRAVTPRGSHSLAPSEVTVYDRPPSQSRMQQLTFSSDDSTQVGSPKPIERHNDPLSTYRRPLPPLPRQAASVTGEHRQNATQSGNSYQVSNRNPFSEDVLVTEELNDSDTKGSPPHKKGNQLILRRPLPNLPIDIKPEQETQLAAAEDTLQSPNSKESSNDTFDESSNSARGHRVLSHNTQEPTAAELYVPRGHWDNIEDDTPAMRQTTLKDANLKCKFGQLPSSHSASPPSISLFRDSYLQPVGHLVNPAPSFHSSTDIQSGPRPPPWGSYEDLEIQRRQRGDARERAKIRANRLTADSSSMYQKSISTDSLGKDPSREVEEYREQILGVYPDMEFNGEAGRGDRGWCCCILM
jgi:hypothetical protein